MMLRILSLCSYSAIAVLGIGLPAVRAADSSSPHLVWESQSGFSTLAQADPSQDRLPELPILVPLPEAEPELRPPSPFDLPVPETDITFPVANIEVLGSTVFDPATLAAIVAPYENREVTLPVLEQAASEITQKYIENGYITSRATIPPQTLTGGIVRIQIIEGGLEAIQVEGTAQLQTYVQNRIALGSSRPLNKARLEEQLRLLRLDPLFERVEASLQAGSDVGQSLLVVRVQESDPLTGSIYSDNASPPAVGDVRFGTRLAWRNPTGLGDTVFGSASITDTAGSKVYDIGYRVPFNAMNGTLQIRYAPNDFRITSSEELTAALETEGSTDIYEVLIRQPLVRTFREEFALSLGYRHRRGSTLIADIITDDTRTNVVSFGQDYLRRGVTGAWGIQSQFRFGWERSDATSFADGDNSSFFSWNGQAQWVRRIGTAHLFTLQTSAQFSPNILPGSEQFFIGGGLSVRGYDPNQRFGDNGVRFSVEDRITVSRYETGLPFVQLAPFLEGGFIANSDDSFLATDNNVLLGTGMGMIFLGQGFRARLDLAYPLIDIQELGTDTSQGLRLHFGINYRF